MRKSLQLFVVGFLVFGLIVLNTASLLVPVSAETKTENQQQHLQSYEPTVTENSILSFNFTKDYYAVGETIVATVQVSSPLTGQPSYDGNGAIVTSAVLSKDNLTATVKMQITGLGEENSLTLLLPTATETMQADVFFYTSHSLVFCGNYKKIAVKYNAIEILLELEKITEQEYNSLKTEMDSAAIIAGGTDVLNYLSPEMRSMQQAKIDEMSLLDTSPQSRSANSGDTSIFGQVLYRGMDGNYYPFKYTHIIICDDSAGKRKELGSTYTNENGEYIFYFTNGGKNEKRGYDLYIEIGSIIRFLTSDDYQNLGMNYEEGVDVLTQSQGAEYKQPFMKDANGESLILVDVLTGSQNYFGAILDLDPETDDNLSEAGEAVIIAQAMGYAALYAATVNYEFLPKIEVRYPLMQDDASYYDPDDKKIFIKQGYHKWWDPVLHEYGHYFADLMGIFEESPGEHSFVTNNNFEQGKGNGLKLAWNEAVATVFAILVTDFWQDEMLGVVNGITNLSYDGYKQISSTAIQSYNFSLENSNVGLFGKQAKGEDCEGAIARVLYDLFDSNSGSEPDDTISFTHWNFWEGIIETEAKTFHDFYSNTLLNKEDLGWILSINGIAPSDFSLLNYSSTSPLLSWDAGNNGVNINAENIGSQNPYKNNQFLIHFYDANDVHLFTKGTDAQPLTSLQYMITPTEWNTILNAPGNSFAVRIEARSSYNATTPTTGWYLSMRWPFSKPMN